MNKTNLGNHSVNIGTIQITITIEYMLYKKFKGNPI